MKRREFCGSALAALVAASTHVGRALADTLAIAVDLPAISGSGKQIVLTGAQVREFRAALRGDLLLASSDGYDQARRIWNGAFDRRPALIARCTGFADVKQAVQFARSNDLLVAVRSGGHSLSGQSVCDGGLMIDLSQMNGVRIDPIARTARVDAGALLGSLDRESQAFGLATTAGTVSHTGVAGLTLGGGFGRIGRKYGLACDNLRSVDLITANGRFVQAAADRNSDLFWGLRGGGGNFGVATSFEFDLHGVSPIMLGGKLVYPGEQARKMLEFFASYVADAPDELYMAAALRPAPDGKRLLLFDICYCGPIETGQRLLQPLRQFQKPLEDEVRPTPYVELQRASDEAERHGQCYYTRTGFVKRLEPALLETLIERTQEPNPVPAIAMIFHCGGAISRVRPDATAYLQREARHGLIVMTVWNDRTQTDEHAQRVRSIWKEVEPFTKGFYANVSGDLSQQRVVDNYGANLGRLVALKDKYDPTNLFRLNANVAPSRSASAPSVS